MPDVTVPPITERLPEDARKRVESALFMAWQNGASFGRFSKRPIPSGGPTEEHERALLWLLIEQVYTALGHLPPSERTVHDGANCPWCKDLEIKGLNLGR